MIIETINTSILLPYHGPSPYEINDLEGPWAPSFRHRGTFVRNRPGSFVLVVCSLWCRFRFTLCAKIDYEVSFVGREQMITGILVLFGISLGYSATPCQETGRDGQGNPRFLGNLHFLFLFQREIGETEPFRGI